MTGRSRAGGAPPLALDVAKLTVETVEQAMREGYPLETVAGRPSARSIAADRLSISRPSLLNRLESAKRHHALEPDESAYRPRVYQHASPGQPQVVFHDHIHEDEPEGDPLEMAAIGDAHDSPSLRDKSRFRWLGAFIEEHGFKRAWAAGDWMTLDSFSNHTDPATIEGLTKPSFQQDLDSLHESQRAFHEGLAGHKPILDMSLGNHEYRAWRWANQHREVQGEAIHPGHRILEAYAQWGWRTTPFGEYRFIQSVGFIHAPLVPGTAGKTYGGKTGAQRAANDMMFDIVRGDDHKFYTASTPKIGPVTSPRIFGTGTAFPSGYVEHYAAKNSGDWWTGICDLTIWGGRVRGFRGTDMLLLKRRYGRSGEGEPKTFTGWRPAA